jgi:hypothetical protein
VITTSGSAALIQLIADSISDWRITAQEQTIISGQTFSGHPIC